MLALWSRLLCGGAGAPRGPALTGGRGRAVDPEPPRPAAAPEPVDQRGALGVQEPNALHPHARVPLAGGPHRVRHAGARAPPPAARRRGAGWTLALAVPGRLPRPAWPHRVWRRHGAALVLMDPCLLPRPRSPAPDLGRSGPGRAQTCPLWLAEPGEALTAHCLLPAERGAHAASRARLRAGQARPRRRCWGALTLPFPYPRRRPRRRCCRSWTCTRACTPTCWPSPSARRALRPGLPCEACAPQRTVARTGIHGVFFFFLGRGGHAWHPIQGYFCAVSATSGRRRGQCRLGLPKYSLWMQEGALGSGAHERMHDTHT